MPLRARKRETYEGWVRDYSAELYRFAYRLCGGPGHAEDLVQETFYHAWRSYRKLRDPRKARAWLFRILRYRYSHWVRDSGHRPATVSLDVVGDAVSPSPDLPASLSDRDVLQRALDALDERHKVPFLMVFVEGLTCREAAEELDLPLGTVLSRIHRARLFLRRFLTRLDVNNDAAEKESGTRERRRGSRSGGER